MIEWFKKVNEWFNRLNRKYLGWYWDQLGDPWVSIFSWFGHSIVVSGLTTLGLLIAGTWLGFTFFVVGVAFYLAKEWGNLRSLDSIMDLVSPFVLGVLTLILGPWVLIILLMVMFVLFVTFLRVYP